MAKKTKASTKPAEAPAATIAVRKPTYVRLKNTLKQPLQISSVNDRGKVVGQRVGPQSISRPIATDRLTTYTEGLIAKGHLRSV